jgi:hypothetical protein
VSCSRALQVQVPSPDSGNYYSVIDIVIINTIIIDISKILLFIADLNYLLLLIN